MPALIGLDIGTSGAWALAVSESGEVIASAAQEYPLLTPRGSVHLAGQSAADHVSLGRLRDFGQHLA